MTSLATALNELRQRLARSSDSASLDAQVLAAHALNKPRAWIAAHPDALLTQEQQDRLGGMARRLEMGEPLPYVLGHWEFFGLDFFVSSDTLIPRPETELLIENGLQWIEERAGRSRALDVGTGSGCIAISLARNAPGLQIVATDISLSALQVARQNAVRHGVGGRVNFLQCDLFPPGNARFDLVCANLPYIPTHKLINLPVSRQEPTVALDGGPTGLALVSQLLRGLPQRLLPGGLALLEIEASQGDSADQLARSAFPKADIQVFPDLAGRDRLLRIQTEIGHHFSSQIS